MKKTLVLGKNYLSEKEMKCSSSIFYVNLQEKNAILRKKYQYGKEARKFSFLSEM
jgi:hypothetical protein